MDPLPTRHRIAPAHLPWWIEVAAAERTDAPRWRSAGERLADHEAAAEGRVGPRTWRAPERAASVDLARAVHRAGERARELSDAVLAGALRSDAGEAFTDLLVLGTAARATLTLAARALGEDVPGRPIGLAPHLPGDADDALPDALVRLAPRLPRTLVLVAGEVEEAAVDVAVDAITARGVDPRVHLVALAPEGAPLHDRARADRWRTRIEAPVDGDPHALADPAAQLGLGLLGLDVAAWLAGAREMDRWTDRSDPASDPATALAAAWAAHGGALVLEPTSIRLAALAAWGAPGPHGAPFVAEVRAPDDPSVPAAWARAAAARRATPRAAALAAHVGLVRLDAFSLAGLLALLERTKAVHDALPRRP